MKDYQLQSFQRKTTIDYANNLNSQQLKVIKEASGPALVLAGAGSGKTRVLIYRLAYLLEQGVHPTNILLATFTNKAAQEMIHRAEVLLKSNLTGLWAGTFHHIANMILRREAHLLGYSSNFTIVDRQDSLSLIQECLEEGQFSKQGKLTPKKNVIANIRSLQASSQKKVSDLIINFYPHLEDFIPQIRKVLARYEKRKKEANTMDFDDLLINFLNVLKEKEICDKYSQMFTHVLVDEYQDTNKVQFQILQKLSSHHNNILVVGDDAQSIYSFRGAQIKNLLDFPQIFKGAKIFRLEINYRSTPQILCLANEIIKHNINQFPKTLRAIKLDGNLPIAVKTNDVYQQAQFVTQRILELNQENISINNIAVLFRSRFQALELEMELIKRNIPYLIRGGMRFFEQSHIKDVMSYLKILVNHHDEISFKRAISLHQGIGRGYAHKIWRKLQDKKTPASIIKELPKKQQTGFRNFASVLGALQKIKEPQKAIKEVLEFYKDYCQLSFENPQDRILDLEELAKMADGYPTIKNFILDLNTEGFKGETILSASEKGETLVLSTIHQAKGLEWKVVFLIGFNDYDFPHPKAIESDEAMEEERRLFYVAATRTKSHLYITYPQNKYTFKSGMIITRGSKFLYELDPDCFEEWNIRGSIAPL
ncbi:MAG: ATP-dependent helicase [Candidatus Omnitrophica bacterium]|nr:ATP-dependent helicase [Candidatus Omnitrophota bacterium]